MMRTEKKTARSGNSRRSVQGISAENDCKIIISHSGKSASPSFAGEEAPL